MATDKARTCTQGQSAPKRYRLSAKTAPKSLDDQEIAPQKKPQEHPKDAFVENRLDAQAPTSATVVGENTSSKRDVPVPKETENNKDEDFETSTSKSTSTQTRQATVSSLGPQAVDLITVAEDPQPNELSLPPMIHTISGKETPPLDDITRALGFAIAERSDRNSPAKGLVNLGNTCYANSILFALASLPAMRSWVYDHAEAHQSTSCVLCFLAADFKALAQANSQDPHCPMVIQRRNAWLPMGYEHLKTSRQQDATEFLLALTEKCHSCDLDLYKSKFGDLLDTSTAFTSPNCNVLAWKATQQRHAKLVAKNTLTIGETLASIS